MRNKYFRSREESSLETKFSEQQTQITTVTDNCQQIANYLYNGDIGLKRWRQAITDPLDGSVINDIIGIGDSILEGAGSDETASNWFYRGWFGRLRTKLADAFGDVGEGVIPIYSPFNNGAVDAGFWQFTGTWSSSTSLGFANTVYRTNVVDASVTGTFHGTSVSLIVPKGSGYSNNVEVKIDGAGAQTIDLTGATQKSVEIVIATGLADEEHTITITNKASAYLTLIGMVSKKGTAGIRVNMCGRSGISTAGYVHENVLYCCTDFMSGISAGANLFVIALGANDAVSQTPIDTYKSRLQTLITRALPFGDVLLVGYGIRNDIGTPTITQTMYNDALRELAYLNGCAFWDVYSMWGTYANAVDTLGYIESPVHPNKGGHYALANIAYNIVTNKR